VSRAKKQPSPAPKKEKPDLRRPADADIEQPAIEDTPEAGSVDKIRDIIFGNQMRDYEKRFAHLEERIFQEIRDLRDDTGNRLNTMETYIQKEIDTLSERLNAEQKLRAESFEKATNEFKAAAKTISESIEGLDDRQSQDSRDLRQQLLEQSKIFSNEIIKKHQESSAALDHSVQELDADKVDRSTLSELLMEMAVRISDDLAAKLKLESSDLK